MILEVQGVSFAYNSHPVLDDVRFAVDAGELVAILGPNGVGKTTLLKCVNAILRPRAGCVLVEDRDLLKMPPRAVAATVGYVAQRTETAPMTVFDAVMMGRTPHLGWRVGDGDRALVESVIGQLGLETLALRPIDRLSGGELQKVAIGRALVQDTRLLLLDEPTSSLDLRNQVEIMTLLRGIVDARRVAAVMTLHDLNTALRFADKVLFVKDGRIFAQGPAAAVTAATVAAVYGVDVAVHRIDGSPVVVPLG